MNGERQRAGRRRIMVCVGVGAFLLLLVGCLVLPTNYYQAGSRHNIKPETADFLVPGITTKEEVLLKLGEPDYASEDGQRFGYAWTKVKAIWIIVSSAPGGIGGGEFPYSDVLMTSFDCSNRVSEVRLLKGWGSHVPSTQELEPIP